MSRWYGDPDYIDTLQRHLGDTRIRMQLVLFDNTPIAYVQDYDIHAWVDHHLSYLPRQSRGIDTFIGVNSRIGQGHGSRYLSLVTQQLFDEGVPALGIDPHPDNAIAIRAYEKVGFSVDSEINSQWGSVLLMSQSAPQAESGRV